MRVVVVMMVVVVAVMWSRGDDAIRDVAHHPRQLSSQD
jgi:hypothetical protein